MSRLRQTAKRLLGRTAAPHQSLKDSYHDSLLALLSCRAGLSVVIVGANDGRINDPFHDFARRFPERTRVLLIEPQAALIPHLAANYAFHPDHRICNAAIGEGGTLTLWRVRPEFWGRIRPGYAAGWPEYRAPTGVTSSQRDHVAAWVAKWSRIPPDEAVEAVTVPCWDLPALLADQGLPAVIDVLQIDAEGADDLVLLACRVEVTRPRIILMETKSLPPPRMAALERHLADRHYDLRSHGGDSLALCLAPV